MKSVSKKTILLVENEIHTAKAEKKTLEKHGFRVIHVVSGEEAVEAVENNPSIGLVLMDIILGDGIDGALAAKKILKKKNIPLVFLSSHTGRKVVEKTEGIASYGYIAKDSGETVLVASIKMALKLHGSRLKEKAKAMREGKNKFHEDYIHGIADCKTAEGALRASEEKYRTLVETTDTGFLIIDRDGRVMDANREYVRLTGHRELGEILGRRVTEWTAEHLMKKNAEAVEKCVRDGLIRNLVIEYTDGEGRATPVEINATVVGEGEEMRIISLCRDITERKVAEGALRASEEKFRSLVENITEVIYTLDTCGRITYMSPMAYQVSGYTADDLIGENFTRFVYPEDLPGLMESYQRTISGMIEPYEYRIVNKDGSLRYIRTSSRMIGDPPVITGFMSDITERKKAEEKIQSLLAEKELFLREVHHRIKNNIASIGSFLSLQSQVITSTEAVSALKDAIGRVNSMAFLYDSLLSSVDYHETSVKRYAGKIIDTVMAIFPGNGRITIEKRIDDFNLDPQVLFPLGLVINELLTNAMKYAFTGRDSGVIEVSLARGENGVALIVRDNGIGLPDGFDIGKSTGFGFFLVDMLVEQLKGIFKIEKSSGTMCVLEFRA